MAAVLQYNFAGNNRDLFLSTLAVAGVDGTLDDRFKGPAVGLRGRVYAKTGFISGVSALSGYLKARDDTWYVFSILMNGMPRFTNTRAKELQEQIVLAIDRNSR
jgi:D-alanyl-D-alanine carboxypeptidase/D-alanyl-D-alanine-endopeptidase (penicillin-binding protein 4)